MTPNSWLAVVGSLAVLLAGAVYCAVIYRNRWLDLRDKSDALLSRLNRAEATVRSYGHMLGDALMSGAEQAAKADATWAKLSPRVQAINEARAKCGPNAPDVVGTFADPVYVQRPDAKLDDWAWVATVEELTR